MDQPAAHISILNGPPRCPYFNPQWTGQWNTHCLDFNLQRTGRLLIFQSPMDQPAAHISIPNGPAGGTPMVLISISNRPADCSYFNPQWTGQWNTHCLVFNLQWTGRLLIFQSPMDRPVEHPLS